MNDSPDDRAHAGEVRRRQLQQKMQRQLDEALAASFPASDPVAIVTSHAEEDWDGERSAPEVPAAPAGEKPTA